MDSYGNNSLKRSWIDGEKEDNIINSDARKQEIKSVNQH